MESSNSKLLARTPVCAAMPLQQMQEHRHSDDWGKGGRLKMGGSFSFGAQYFQDGKPTSIGHSSSAENVCVRRKNTFVHLKGGSQKGEIEPIALLC